MSASLLRTALRPMRLAAGRTPVFAARAVAARSFHASRPALIKVGDELPDLAVLMENTPGTTVNLAEEAKRKRSMLVLGVPGAFSPACSSAHVPSYISHPRIKEFDDVVVVAMNDVFVMKAWSETLDPAGQVGIRFLADPQGIFTKALDMSFDGAAAIFGGERSRRYALIVEDGKVKTLAVEPDNTGTKVSMADKVLGA